MRARAGSYCRIKRFPHSNNKERTVFIHHPPNVLTIWRLLNQKKTRKKRTRSRNAYKTELKQCLYSHDILPPVFMLVSRLASYTDHTLSSLHIHGLCHLSQERSLSHEGGANLLFGFSRQRPRPNHQR